VPRFGLAGQDFIKQSVEMLWKNDEKMLCR
jgi:hypothetical protein